MENRVILKTIVFSLALFLSAFSYIPAFAYSAATTHPALASTTVDFYNHFYSGVINDEDKQYIEWGASGEDDPAFRVLNHFYDPVYDVGLLHANNSAKEWEESAEKQAKFFGNYSAGVDAPLYSSDSDYSWERSIYEYVHGDRRHALEGLGHALHIVQDMTVPAHVRDDQHLAGADESPYETWTAQYGFNNITTAQDLISEGRTPVYYDSLDEYIEKVAAFTNAHFFSKDTLPFLEEWLAGETADAKGFSGLATKGIAEIRYGFSKYIPGKDLFLHYLPGSYSESSFISEDKYPVPDYSFTQGAKLSNGETQSLAVGRVKSLPYELFGLTEKEDVGSGQMSRRYWVKTGLENEPILESYWQILSREAVVNGAGVVKLFFDEVEEEKQTHALQAKNVSFLAKFVPDVKQLAQNIVRTAQRQGADNSGAAVIQSTPVTEETLAAARTIYELDLPPVPEETLIQLAEAKRELEEAAKAEKARQEEEARRALEQKEEEINKDTEEEVVLEEEEKSVFEETDTQTDIPNLAWLGVDLGGNDALVKRQEAAKVEAEREAALAEEAAANQPNAPTVDSPSSGSQFATTAITFSGIGLEATASSTPVISQDFSSATTTTDESGAWELVLADFAEGTTTIAFTLTSGTSTSGKTEVSVYVDTSAPTIESFVVEECSYSLRSDACLLGGGDTTLSWSVPDATSYKIFKDSTLLEETTATNTTTTLAVGEATLELVAYDAVGNAATSSTQTVEVYSSPIVINEIAWAGTASSTADEWVELYNRSSYTLDLSSIVLYADDLGPYLSISGTVAPSAYYLIERTDGNTTSESEDLATAFSGLDGGSGLSNDGEKLILVQSFGGVATSTLDQTPDISMCGGWCAGEATSTPTSMERVHAENSGTDQTNWNSNNTSKVNGTDVGGNPIYGTPNSLNSSTPPPMPGVGF